MTAAWKLVGVTHENEEAVIILLPTIGPFIVFFLCHLHIHIEKRP
jgi:hypothetical protein